MSGRFSPMSLDHVAVWVTERQALSALLCDHLGMRVHDLEDAVGRLPMEVERDADGVVFEAPDGLRLGLVEAEGVDFDLHHVVLRLPDPEGAASELAAMGFERRNGHVAVADRQA